MVGLQKHGEILDSNFGQRPFKYDIEKELQVNFAYTFTKFLHRGRLRYSFLAWVISLLSAVNSDGTVVYDSFFRGLRFLVLRNELWRLVFLAVDKNSATDCPTVSPCHYLRALLEISRSRC